MTENMFPKNKLHFTIVSVANVALIINLLRLAYLANDQGIILVAFGYPFLIFVNTLLWVIFSLLNKEDYKVYRISTIGLILFYIPAIILGMILGSI